MAPCGSRRPVLDLVTSLNLKAPRSLATRWKDQLGGARGTSAVRVAFSYINVEVD